MDVVGENIQPEENVSRQSFLFFLILAMLAMTCMIMFLSIIYYHYIMISLRNGRKYLMGESAALWCTFEERLLQVSHDTSASWSRLKPHGDRYVALFLWRRIKSKKYQFIMVPLVTIPFLMMICLYQSTYGRPYMIWYDCVFTVLYLIEYLARVVIMGKFLYRPTGWTELGIGLFLLSFLFWVAVYGTDDTYASLGVRVCVIARCFRLMHTYPQYMVIWRTLVMGLSGVVPTLAYLIVFVLIYAVIGNVVLGDIQPAWDDPFLYTRYNFTNYVNAFITLMAMGSGNMWTEMLVKLQDGQEWYLQVFIEFYLVTYYLVVTIIVRSFALMIISKYLTQGGLDLGLAGQQLRRFRRSWSAVNGSNTSMDISKLFDFICTLKYPLGTKSNKFVLVERSSSVFFLYACGL